MRRAQRADGRCSIGRAQPATSAGQALITTVEEHCTRQRRPASMESMRRGPPTRRTAQHPCAHCGSTRHIFTTAVRRRLRMSWRTTTGFVLSALLRISNSTSSSISSRSKCWRAGVYPKSNQLAGLQMSVSAADVFRRLRQPASFTSCNLENWEATTERTSSRFRWLGSGQAASTHYLEDQGHNSDHKQDVNESSHSVRTRHSQ